MGLCEGKDIWDGDIVVAPVKSGYKNEGFCLSLNDSNENENFLKNEGGQCCERHEQRAYASYEVVASKTMKTSFVLVRGESGGKEEVWVAKVLVVSSGSARGRDEKRELAHAPYMTQVGRRCVFGYCL